MSTKNTSNRSSFSVETEIYFTDDAVSSYPHCMLPINYFERFIGRPAQRSPKGASLIVIKPGISASPCPFPGAEVVETNHK